MERFTRERINGKVHKRKGQWKHELKKGSMEMCTKERVNGNMN